MIRIIAFLVWFLSSLNAAQALEQPLNSSSIIIPDPLPWPVTACSFEELERLRSAWSGTGLEHEVVAPRVEKARAVLDQEPTYPPEGGQHNQWFQVPEVSDEPGDDRRDTPPVS